MSAVLVVDDVHWADAPSLRWLALLARSVGELRIGVLCAVRVGEPGAPFDLVYAEHVEGDPFRFGTLAHEHRGSLGMMSRPHTRRRA